MVMGGVVAGGGVWLWVHGCRGVACVVAGGAYVVVGVCVVVGGIHGCRGMCGWERGGVSGCGGHAWDMTRYGQ